MEKGVGVWLRDASTDEWHHSIVVNIVKSKSQAKSCQVTLRLTEGPNVSTEQTMTIDIDAIENDETTNAMLANSSDMNLVEDLIQLPNLHEPGICHTLKSRFQINEIYTLTGEILLAINPFKPIGVYSDKIIRKYVLNGDQRALGNDVQDMPPHIFSIADKAYRSLMNPITGNSNIADQSILVSGESGAGKTESTKFVMKYLAKISQSHHASRSSVSLRDSVIEVDSHVMKQVLSSNPILESFGNARTIRNDNSSRFGKFIKMQFSDRGNLIGASIQTYLLEKVRLTYQAENERNYHIFYEMIAGASESEKQRWHLMSTKKFHYLNQSSCMKRKDGVSDAEQFRILKNAMETMGFNHQDIENIFLTVSTLLHIGNLEFTEVHLDSGVEGSEFLVGDDVVDRSLEVILNFLEVDKKGLEETLCYRQIQAKSDSYSISLNCEAAENTRDALSRFLYGKLFDQIVQRINSMVDCDEDEKQYSSGFIGLLDIFGFEDLAYNSFEQLCINYANETLQQHFNRTVLRLEQETYEKEQIQWSFINFPDNSACIELIEGKPLGVLNSLDEECIVPKGNDQQFVNKMYQRHEKNPHFSADRTQKASYVFVIHHYAGAVAYDSFGFCEKNKDIMYPEIITLLKKSSKDFVRNLLLAGSEDNAKPKQRSIRRKQASLPQSARSSSVGGSNRISLGSQFRTQLRELIDTIGRTNCHYVRCLKPNDNAQAALFMPKRICDQLKAGGVLEAVRVNRSGYPVRLSHQQFIKRYRQLANGPSLKQIPDEAGKNDNYDPDERREACQVLVNHLLKRHKEKYPDLPVQTVSEIQVGITRIFFRRTAIQFVEAQLARRYGEFIVLIQAMVRSFLAQKHFQRQKLACGVLQRVVRGHLARCLFEEMKEKERQRKEAEERARREREHKKQMELERKRMEHHKTVESTRSTSDSTASPVSDDSDEENVSFVLGKNSNDKAERFASGPDRTTAIRVTSKGTSRFRFTKDYGDLNETIQKSGLRSVMMDPGDTVLHVAANCCNERDVLKLLQNGSDINAKNRQGRTPLHTAARHENSEVVKILLEWNADVCAQDDDGNTPLHLALDVHIARLLLEAGCTPNIVNNEGRTVLIEAVDRGDQPIVNLLLQFKADVCFRELKHHQTALHLAVRKSQYAIVSDLITMTDPKTAKTLIQLTDRNENNALHFSVSRDRKNGTKLLDTLIKYGADVNKVNARFQTPLVVHIMTTRQVDASITELLLARGSDPNVHLADGSTLLHVAAERELIDIACCLLRYGAYLNQPDGNGRLVCDIVPRKYIRKLFTGIVSPPQWIEDKNRKSCMVCNSPFKFGSRRHHCRHCGRICCSEDSSYTVEMFKFPVNFPGRVTPAGKNVKDPQRVCRTCYSVFKLREAQKESKSGFMARVLGYEWDEVAHNAP